MKKALFALIISAASVNVNSYDVSDIKEISPGKYKTFFLLNNGYLYTTNKSSLKSISNLELISSNVVSSSIGGSHAFKINNEKELFTVGNNSFGELGISSFEDKEVWEKVIGVDNVKKVVAKNNVSFAINEKNVLYAAGSNFHKLIDNKNKNINVFSKIAENVKDVTGSTMYIAYLDQENNLYIKGHPQYGFLSTEEFVKIAENVDSISGGHYHLLFSQKGKLNAIGANHQGQLATTIKKEKGYNFLSNFTSEIVNVAIDVKSFSAGSYHSLYISNSDDLYVSGNNGNGQLGIGSQILSKRWIKTLGDVDYAVAGSYTNFAVKKDNTLWVSGNNAQGQLSFNPSDENTYFYGKEMRTNIESWSWIPMEFKTFKESYK